jgi:integrase
LDGYDAVRARQSKHVPTVLTPEEIQQVLQRLEGTHQLIAKLLYGAGLRVKEGLRLRVKDLDFAQNQLIIRDAKGNKDRLTVLPQSLIAPLLD